MAAPADDDSPGIVAFRLTAVERQLREFREEVRGYTLVTRDTYERDRSSDQRIADARDKAADDFAAETRAIATAARAVSMWALGVTILLGIGGLVGLLRLAVS